MLRQTVTLATAILSLFSFKQGYSEDLATTALAWALTCPNGHDAGDARKEPPASEAFIHFLKGTYGV